MSKKSWRLILASNPSNITEVESFLNDIYAETKWHDDIQANIGIALTEIVNNAILHGNKSDESKQVEVEINANEKWIEMRVTDEGEADEEIGIPDPTQPENLLKTNGRGLFLVEHFMDEVNVIPAKSGTTVAMKLKIQS